jgi:lipoprotein-releasing system permease protein
MIISFAILFGFKNAIRQNIFSLSSPIKVTKFSANESVEQNPISKKSPLILSKDKISGIRNISFSAHKAGILKTTKEILGVVMQGVDSNFDTLSFQHCMVEGSFPVLSNDSISKEIVISRKIANKLQLKLNDKLIIYFLNSPERPRKLTVKGVYETHLEEYDNQVIIGDLGLIQKINGWGADSVGSYDIYLKDFSQLNEVKKQVTYFTSIDMKTETVIERFNGIFDWLAMLDKNMQIFLFLIFFVASFNMISILLVMMLERTSMIGLLQSLGANNWQIRQIFLHLGIQILIKGIIIGNVIGLLLCFLQYKFKLIQLAPESYYMSTVPIFFDWWVIFLINISTFFMVMLVLIIPTYIITKIEPSKAIVFKK